MAVMQFTDAQKCPPTFWDFLGGSWWMGGHPKPCHYLKWSPATPRTCSPGLALPLFWANNLQWMAQQMLPSNGLCVGVCSGCVCAGVCVCVGVFVGVCVALQFPEPGALLAELIFPRHLDCAWRTKLPLSPTVVWPSLSCTHLHPHNISWIAFALKRIYIPGSSQNQNPLKKKLIFS